MNLISDPVKKLVFIDKQKQRWLYDMNQKTGES